MAYSKGVKLEDELTDQIVDVATKIAYTDGVAHISVKRIINELGVSNRVFYNRFKNIQDVLDIVYHRIVKQMRECINTEYDESCDYYDYLQNIGVAVLKRTYEDKLHFSQYMFEYDSYSESNRNWWIDHIKPLIQYGIDNGLLKEVNTTYISYSIWCFCRGFNADAVGTGLTLYEALDSFKLGLSCIIEGMKPDA